MFKVNHYVSVVNVMNPLAIQTMTKSTMPPSRTQVQAPHLVLPQNIPFHGKDIKPSKAEKSWGWWRFTFQNLRS